ncbi:PREDICTED: putative leucine-rich repeat-containing protein DDB_G0290503 [Nanorana parkeri]|uniref:putative leucine-rich repeat-containing protein DDB_G0290503 n=1 Tax=Nanorana parkeri TaxID=125878 RepID=UPI000853FAC9|nr:PREDICTED: putative leucine-rich repeat-containing protein DDB_G0290503 [Nanorana parkeri]
MSYRANNGYVSLPSRYGYGSIENFQHHLDNGRRSPRLTSRDLGSCRHGLESPRPFGLSELEKNIAAAGHIETENWTGQWKDYPRGPMSPRHTDRARSVSPLRGIHSLEYFARNLSSPTISRRNSLSRLSTLSPEESVLELSMTRRGWSGSEMDLRASLSESAQKRVDLVQRLRETQGKLEEQSEEIRMRDKELEMSRAKTELLALKQKQLEASISQLEKEKGWLEVSRFEDKKQRGELQDRIINLEMEVMLAKSSLENFNYTNEFMYQKTPMGNEDTNRELKTARENLIYFRNRVKVLEAEKSQAVEELRTFREGSHLALSQTNEANQRVTDTLRTHQNLQEELSGLQMNFNKINLEKELLSSKAMRFEEKVSDLTLRLKIAQSDKERYMQEKLELHRRTQELSLELERAKRGREGFNDQVSDLHIELVGAKTQANRQDQEKVQMKEELVMLKQVNEKLTDELGQTQQTLQNTLEQLHQTQAEHKIASNLSVALEAERKQLLEEKQLLMAAVENDEESRSVQDFRASQEHLQEERDKLQAHCRELQATLEQAHEQLGSQIQEQQQITLYWKERWQQTAVNLKNVEELLEQERAHSQKATGKNTELLQDCEMLQADTEELSELKAAVSRLKEENNRLSQHMVGVEQRQHLQHLQNSIQEKNEGMTTQLKDLYGELQQAHEKIKDLEKEKSDKELEMRKLKNENGSVLRIELDACRQQLELDRSRREVLQSRVGELEAIMSEERKSKDWLSGMGSQNSVDLLKRLSVGDVRAEIQNLEQQLEKEKETRKQKDELIFTLKEELEDLKCKKPGDIKASLEEVDSELVLVREELQKVWNMLKSKDTELEEQYQELESARDQYTECSSEKVKLEQLVTSLQKQIEEKEQSVKHLQQIKEMEKTEMDIERSSLELKLAEMQEQCGKISPNNTVQGAKTGVKSWSPGVTQPAASLHKCTRCDVFLQQLEKAIKGYQERNVELREEKNQTLVCLYQLQDVLKDLSKQTKINEQVAQNLQVDNDTLKQQHKMVTEQLKGLFKEKKNLESAYKKFPKEEKPADDWTVKSKLVKNVLESVKAHKEHQEELGKEKSLHKDLEEKDVTKLQKQLEEKSEKISTMAFEIKMLREKNESLMKAKLRFQQQVQQIRSVSQPHEKEPTDPIVPRLSGHTKYTHKDNELESASQGSSTPLTGTQTPEGSWAGSQQSSRSPTPINTNNTTSSPVRLNFTATMSRSWRNSMEGSLLSPRSNADSEGPLTPRASALLSPRPYQPRNTQTLQKFGES